MLFDFHLLLSVVRYKSGYTIRYDNVIFRRRAEKPVGFAAFVYSRRNWSGQCKKKNPLVAR